MRRYWLDQSSIQGEEVLIGGESFHHICVVCRQKEGSRFEILCADQKAYFVEILDVLKKSAIAKILEVRSLPEPLKPRIHLALSLPKFPTLEKVIEKSVELGVDTLHLFSSDYSFMKAKPRDLAKKQARWQKIILGATQQTGRGSLMGLTDIIELSVLLERFSAQKGAQGLLAYEGDGEHFQRGSFSEQASSLEDIWIFVGSEGGFSEQDIKLFSNYNLLPVSLGGQILRVETACVTLLSILKYEVGHFDGGK